MEVEAKWAMLTLAIYAVAYSFLPSTFLLLLLLLFVYFYSSLLSIILYDVQFSIHALDILGHRFDKQDRNSIE